MSSPWSDDDSEFSLPEPEMSNIAALVPVSAGDVVKVQLEMLYSEALVSAEQRDSSKGREACVRLAALVRDALLAVDRDLTQAELGALTLRALTEVGAVSHDLQFVSDIATCLAVLSQGHLVSEGPAPELLADKELMDEAGLEVPPLLQLLHAARSFTETVTSE